MLMTYEQAVVRLRNHSNLGPGADNDSLLHALWYADQSGTFPDLTRFIEDILACLTIVNVELNGRRPSETSEYQNPGVISEIAAPVSGLIVGLIQKHRRWSGSPRFPAASIEALRDAALRIGLAWTMVLDGDIDNLIAGVEDELAASD